MVSPTRRMIYAALATTGLALIVALAFVLGRRSAYDHTSALRGPIAEAPTLNTADDKEGPKVILDDVDQPDIADIIPKTTAAPQEQRPPLSKLIDEDAGTIIGDVSFLLDFAIVGHSKTATTQHMNWLADHPEVQMYHHEVHSLKNSRPAEFVSLMYDLKPGSQYKRGYKAPNDIHYDQSMDALRKYWPDAGLIVGVRHPVKWFASYYNFNARQGNQKIPAEQMIGKHFDSKVMYHQHLAMLGKTPLGPDELELLGWDSKPYLPITRAKVFVYDVSQPFDFHNQTRVEQYCQDLSDFVGLSKRLEPVEARTTSRNTNYAIDICEEKYTELRKELLEAGRTGSIWIRDYFMKSPDVTVSTPQHFNDILSTWTTDPCVNATK